MRIAVLCSSVASARAIELTIRSGPHEHLFSESNPRRALELLATAKADLLIVDAGLRAPTSAELTRSVLASSSCAVLLVATGEPSTSLVYQGMASGALDVAQCPELDEQGALTAQASLLSKLRIAARLLGRSDSQSLDREQALTAIPVETSRPTLVALGASTGGPAALHHILGALPGELSVAIVIVQHLESALVSGLASWLQSATGMRVELATQGSRPRPRVVQIAASDDHLVMSADGTYQYVAEPRDLIHRPSIDVLFASLAAHWPTPGVAALLTGMGRDGALGLKQLRDRKWHTLAQDERSSIVYGMPKAAAELGAATRILSLQELAPAIAHAARSQH